jgi:hypothetical protein
MTLYEILIDGGLTLIVVLSIIQVTPIKVNPWDKIARAVGKMLNADVMERLDETKADTARYRIIRFADEIRQGILHSEEHFGQILSDIKMYEDYCSTHPAYKNQKAVMAIDKIEKTYRKCMDEDSFI